MKSLTSASIFWAIAASVVLSACGSRQASEYRSVKPSEFAQTLAEGAQVLDVRTQDEYLRGHLRSAINIDVKKPDFALRADSILDKGRPVCVYCKSGRRSKAAANILSDKGYEVVELDCGYECWMEQNMGGVDYGRK